MGETEISIHPVLLAYLLYAFITGHGSFMVLATLSILLHETAHASVSAIFSHPPRSIEITPLGAVMRLEDDARHPPLKRVVVLLAGPAMTLLLCLLAFHLSWHGILPLPIGRMLFLSNISILILNLLPALPLDGGRVLALLLEQSLPLHLAQRIMRCIGTILGFGMILLNIYTSWKMGGWNLSLAFAGCCLMYSAAVATTSQALAELQQLMDRKIQLERKGALKSVVITVQSRMQLQKMLRMLPARKHVVFFGIEIGSMHYTGWLTEHEVIQHYLKNPGLCFSDVIESYPERSDLAQKSTK